MAPRSTLTRDAAARLQVSARPSVDRSRLAVYTTLGASAGALPLPWLPDALLRRVRGALVHDCAVRHGLSLTREARAILSEPSGSDGPRGLASQALRYLGVRLAVRALARFGPIAAVWPLRDALRTYALGHLFDRYLDTGRTDRAVRIDADEARHLRRAIDSALARALTIEPLSVEEPAAIDDQRDAATALVDWLIGLAAGLPDRLLRRLDAAFDDRLGTADG
ncbi:MAG TPA: hypothetical protein VN894_16060 [Polyangiaceae bacterium]|nr:hypothetical protein [Polyangiaceae bacterium]